jgi:hypothetical protein
MNATGLSTPELYEPSMLPSLTVPRSLFPYPWPLCLLAVSEGMRVGVELAKELLMLILRSLALAISQLVTTKKSSSVQMGLSYWDSSLLWQHRN